MTTSLEVVQRIIAAHDLHRHKFSLIAHQAVTNWNQKYPSLADKIAHLPEGLLVNDLRKTIVSGAEIANLETVDLNRFVDSGNELISLASSVITPDGAELHLALMNLHFDEFATRKELAQAVLYMTENRPAWLVKTDRYYHVYGNFLLDPHGWRKWNEQYLLSNGMAGSRYIGYSLRRGYNLLRLNEASRIKTYTPTVDIFVEPGLPEVSNYIPGDETSSRAEAAVKLARRMHRFQKRKSGEPYIIHLEETAQIAVDIVRELIEKEIISEDEVSIDKIYACGYLHDLIEDTIGDYEDVVRAAGEEVADWVALLSKDSRLPEPARESEYYESIATACLAVRIVKLADILSNLREIRGVENPDWLRTWLGRRNRVLAAVGKGLHGTSAAVEASNLTTAWTRRLSDDSQ